MALSKLRVRQLMAEKIVSAPAPTTVKQVAILMKKNGVGSVLVGELNDPIGIVTETDIVHRAVAEDRSPLVTRVESIMSYPLITVEAEGVAIEAADIMAQNGIRHLAVTEKGKVIGIVSMRDLLHPLTASQES